MSLDGIRHPYAVHTTGYTAITVWVKYHSLSQHNYTNTKDTVCRPELHVPLPNTFIATFGHSCTWIKTLRSVRSLSDPKQQGKKLAHLPGSTDISDMERQSQGSWARAIPSVEESVSLSFCWLMNLWSRTLVKKEVETRKGEVSQGKKSNLSKSRDQYLLFLGLGLLCVTCSMSTTMSGTMEKRVFLWINFQGPLQWRKGHERWEKEESSPALLIHGWQIRNGWHCWRVLSFWERTKGNLVQVSVNSGMKSLYQTPRVLLGCAEFLRMSLPVP